MPLKLNSSGGGSVTLDVPSTASTFTATVPAQTGTLITSAGSAVVTPTMLSQPLTLMTAKAYNWNGSSTNTFLDFESIPSWVRKITVIFQGVSTNGTSNYLIQAATSSGVTTSGYLGAGGTQDTTVGTTNYTTGFGIRIANIAHTVHGAIILYNITGNSWVASGVIALSNVAAMGTTAGSIALSGTLDRIRITTVNGTDTFDAGTINVMYEG